MNRYLCTGGHIIGHRFMGDQGGINLFPQEGNFNNSAYRTMENELADWVKNGKQVNLKVDLDPPGAIRPDKVIVKYNITDPASGKIVYSNQENFYNQANQTFERMPSSDMIGHQQ